MVGGSGNGTCTHTYSAFHLRGSAGNEAPILGMSNSALSFPLLGKHHVSSHLHLVVDTVLGRRERVSGFGVAASQR